MSLYILSWKKLLKRHGLVVYEYGAVFWKLVGVKISENPGIRSKQWRSQEDVVLCSKISHSGQQTKNSSKLSHWRQHHPAYGTGFKY